MIPTISIIILGAGKGTRMKSDLPKVMHKIAGREMLNMVIDEAKTINPQNITIVISDEMTNYQKQITQNHSDLDINFAIQIERKGTGHAVIEAVKTIKNLGEKVIILYGDSPLIGSDTIKKMSEKLDNFDLCILGFDETKPNKYGRLVIDKNGSLEKIVEFKDANESEQNIILCNSGIVAVNGKKLDNLLSKITNNNASNEYYLTDIVEIAGKEGYSKTYLKTDGFEVLGVNSKVDLANLENIKQNQLRQRMMEEGVTLLDPNSTYFSFDTKISKNSIIHPQVFFGNKVEIAENVEVKSFSHIEGAKIAENVVIGPFARIRPETILEKDVKIGNFVEIKKSKLKSGSKVNHLSYIGDSEVGTNSNIGAGTITCNYDGHNKYKTSIGDNVFVGSNTLFIAPIKVGDNSVIGAGSVITKEVGNDDLAVSRAKQLNIKNGGSKFHKTRLNK